MLPTTLVAGVVFLSVSLAVAFHFESIIGAIAVLSGLLLFLIRKQLSKRKAFPQQPNMVAPLIQKHIFGHIGLINIGNTCYMNTVLQCLISTHQLTSIFYSQDYRAARNQNYTDKTDGRLLEQYHRFLKNMESRPNSPKAYDPTELWKAIGQRNSSLSDKHQHDAQEMILTILSGLHEDTNQITAVPEYEQLPKEGNDEHLSPIWEAFKKRYISSKLNNILIGQFKNVEICKKCNKESKNFDQFFIINLPLLRSNLSKSSQKHDGMTLNSCLKEFRAEMTLEYACDRCNQFPLHRISIYKAKPIVIFALPRFTMNFTKVNKFISFELKMNMREHMERAEKDAWYELYAVAYHYGSTLHSGHYIARCKQEDGKWYEYNDEYVHALNCSNEEELQKAVVSREASILFYRRMSN